MLKDSIAICLPCILQVLFRMLKRNEKLVLPQLNAYFPRSGFQSQMHVSTWNFELCNFLVESA